MSYYEKQYTLDEVLPYEQPSLYIVKTTNYNDSYDTPVLTPGKSFVLGYTDEKELSASVVSGRVYVQGTINGVENTIAVSGDAVAAGAGGEVAITDTGASASIDTEIIAGIGLAISSVWGD